MPQTEEEYQQAKRERADREYEELRAKGYDDDDIAAVHKLAYLYDGITNQPNVEWVPVETARTIVHDAPAKPSGRTVHIPVINPDYAGSPLTPLTAELPDYAEMREYIRTEMRFTVRRVIRTMYIRSENTLRIYYGEEVHTFDVWAKAPPATTEEADHGQTGTPESSTEHL